MWDISKNLSFDSSVGQKYEIITKDKRSGKSLQIKNIIVIYSRLEPGMCWFGYKILKLVFCDIVSGSLFGWAGSDEAEKTGRLFLEEEKVVFRPRQVKNLTRSVLRQCISAVKNTVWYVKSLYLVLMILAKVSAFFWFGNKTKQISAPEHTTEKKNHKTFQNLLSGMIAWRSQHLKKPRENRGKAFSIGINLFLGQGTRRHLNHWLCGGCCVLCLCFFFLLLGCHLFSVLEAVSLSRQLPYLHRRQIQSK